MRYTEKSFSVPVGGKVSQEEWDRIFGKKEEKKDGRKEDGESGASDAEPRTEG